MLTKCTTCQKDIAESARICPHCGGRKPWTPEEQFAFAFPFMLLFLSIIAWLFVR